MGVNIYMPRIKSFQKCVYKIIFNSYDKIYIGSTCRWPYRKTEHLTTLKSNKHFNQYLQRVFNKLGEECIKIEPIEFCDKKNINEREQYWIDFYDSTNPNKGFNLVKLVNSRGTLGYKYTKKQKEKISAATKLRMQKKEEREKISITLAKKIKKDKSSFGGKFAAKTFLLISPDGKNVEIYNLCKFCRDNELDYKKMIAVSSGKRIEYLGWKKTNRKNKNEKQYEFISPLNELVKITNLKKFCEDNNLPLRTMYAIHQDIGISCKGWKKSKAKNTHHKGKPFILKSPNGEIINNNNLSKFCKENGLCIRSLKKGFKSKGYQLIIPKLY